MIAWMFPGQGSQREGMAGGLAACRELFGVARPILGPGLERICTMVPNSTWPAALLQPALFTTCVGAARAALDRGLRPDAVVGHSLGEYAALVAAGALAFDDGLELVSLRGRAMEAAARRSPGGMAAVIGLEPERIEEICTEIGDVWVANRNTPKQTVISGKDEPLARAAELCRQAGAMRVIRLEVPIAGHSPLMESAAREVESAIGGAGLRPPEFPLYSVVDARPHTEPEEIRTLLVAGITSPVRFADTVAAMNGDGIDTFVEVGPGRVLTGLVRQTLTGVEFASVSSDDEADALAAAVAAPDHKPTTLAATTSAAPHGGTA